MKRWGPAAGAVLLTVVFVALALHRGVPVLRHDWGMPHTREAWISFAVSSVSGWDSRGIGAPQPYPTLFVIGPVLAAVALLLGSQSAVAMFLIGIAAGFLWAGIRIGRMAGGDAYYGLALAAILLFSPWAYEELAAGHLTMMLSLSACAVLASELLTDEPRKPVLLLFSYIAAFQIQYALLAVLVPLAVSPTKRCIAVVAAGSALSLLPSIVGICLNYSTLAAIAYTIPWQRSNSVPLSGGALLDGYAQHYTAAAGSVFFAAGLIAVFAVFGGGVASIAVNRSRKTVLRSSLLAAGLLAYCSGLAGPFSKLYQASLSFRQTLVFRELFDLIGMVALLYVIIIALGSRRSRIVRICACASAGSMLVAWLISPPAHWWVPARDVPVAGVSQSVPNTRFLLLPARQPLQFNGNGSGADLDAFARPNNVTPLNMYVPVYPTNAAVGEYTLYGDTSGLKALSVTEIYPRPWLSTDIETLRTATPAERGADRTLQASHLDAAAELSVVPLPPSTTTLQPFQKPFLLYGGDPRVLRARILPVRASLDETDPARAWVDAALTFSRYPRMATPLGGAFTTSHTAMLFVPSRAGSHVMAYVDGALLDQAGGVLAKATSGWKWIALNNASGLRCKGACAVTAWESRTAAASVPTPEKTMRPHRAAALPVAFQMPAPFIAIGTVPGADARNASMLLFRTRYDPSWTIFGLRSARHLQVSGAFNGYALEPSVHPRAFVIVETTAILQILAMLFSLGALAVILGVMAPRKKLTFGSLTTAAPELLQ